MLNLTPHAISIKNQNGTITIPPSGTIARVQTKIIPIHNIDVEDIDPDNQGNTNGIRVDVVEVVIEEVIGLPPEGTPCLVSAMVRAAVPGRKGVYSPDTDQGAIRNDKGQIIGTTRLIRA